MYLKHGTAKSGKARVIPLTPRASDAARVMLGNHHHRAADDDWVGHRWGLVRHECGIADVNVHILRHTWASRLLARGVDL